MSEQTRIQPALINRAAAARYLSISERHLANLLADGRLASVRIGRSVRFHVTDLDEFIRRRTIKAR